MSEFDNRSEKRKKVCVQAFAADSKDTFNIKCIIRDVSMSGCMIVSSQIRALPDLIQLIPERFNWPLDGRIVWRNDKMAGIKFLSPNKNNVQLLMKEQFRSAMFETDSDEPLPLEAFVRPLSYSERLADYLPPKV